MTRGDACWNRALAGYKYEVDVRVKHVLAMDHQHAPSDIAYPVWPDLCGAADFCGPALTQILLSSFFTPSSRNGLLFLSAPASFSLIQDLLGTTMSVSPLFRIVKFAPYLPFFSYRNSTVLTPATYWGQYQHITKSNTHLSVAERLWVAWYAWVQNDVLATGIMSFAIHELFYFGRSLPWVLIDSLGFFKRYKIQSVSGKPKTWH